MNLADHEAERLFRSLDDNDDDELQFQEYLRLFKGVSVDQEIARAATPEERQLGKLRRIFNAADKDKDGFIEASEWRGAMKNLGMEMTEEQSDTLFNSLDLAKDELLSFDEFAMLFNQNMRLQSPTDSPQMVTREIRPALPSLSTAIRNELLSSGLTEAQIAAIPELLDAADVDRSGYINAKEFKKTVEALDMKLSDMQVNKIFKKTDISVDDKLDFNEFLNLVVEAAREKREEQRTALQEKQISRIRQIFDAADPNKDGYINADEFVKAMEALGMKMSQLQAKKLFKMLDIGGDSRLNFEEFLHLVQEATREKGDEQKNLPLSKWGRLRQIFDAADTQKNGSIDAKEFKTALEALGMTLSPLQTKKLYKSLDINADSKLDFEEFKQLTGEAVKEKREEDLKPLPEGTLPRIRLIFDAADPNKDGYINAEEFKNAMESLGLKVSDKQATKLFKAMDIGGDSKLSFEEFSQLIQEAAKGRL
jgi:Ca2+-binding EF-hand superfamily protein